jgi:hypothetical protein
VWELSNEPYLFPTFFATGADYIAKMKPYRDAIKAADPNAIVSIFFADPSAFSVAKPSPVGSVDLPGNRQMVGRGDLSSVPGREHGRFQPMDGG